MVVVVAADDKHLIRVQAPYRVRARNDRSRATIAKHQINSTKNEAIEPHTTAIITRSCGVSLCYCVRLIWLI